MNAVDYVYGGQDNGNTEASYVNDLAYSVFFFFVFLLPTALARV